MRFVAEHYCSSFAVQSLMNVSILFIGMGKLASMPSGGGGAAPAAAAGDAAPAAAKEEKKVESEEESDDDMGFDLFG